MCKYRIEKESKKIGQVEYRLCHRRDLNLDLRKSMMVAARKSFQQINNNESIIVKLCQQVVKKITEIRSSSNAITRSVKNIKETGICFKVCKQRT